MEMKTTTRGIVAAGILAAIVALSGRGPVPAIAQEDDVLLATFTEVEARLGGRVGAADTQATVEDIPAARKVSREVCR